MISRPISLLVLLLTAIFQLPSQAQVNDFSTTREGDVVANQFQYGRRTLTLPDGKWRLVVKRERNSTVDGSGVTMLEASFDEVVEQRLNRTLQVVATKQSKTTSWIDEPCKTLGDSFWMDDRKRSSNDQFCVRVGYLSGVVEQARGDVFQEWARQIVSSGITYSPEMPYVSVVRFTGYDYLRMTISLNPASSGIGRSEHGERHLNEWNPRRVPQNPRVKGFYESLQAWAPQFADAVSRAFEGDKVLKPSDYGRPTLP